MLVPGANLAKLAFKVIARATVDYYKFTSRTLNSVGLYVSVYDTATPIRGSWQPVPRNLYEQLGLDLNKNYAMFYTTTDVRDVNRDVAGDKIHYQGRIWQVLSANDWIGQDGWTGVLSIDVGPIPAPPPPPEEPEEPEPEPEPETP